MSNLKTKLQTMLSIQEELNQIVDPNWKERGFRWEDAVVVEAVELFDHLPWKWWKQYAKPVDYQQVKLEAIDIWHFILSRMIEDFGPEKATTILTDFFSSHDTDISSQPDWAVVQGSARTFLADVATSNTQGRDALAYLGSFGNLLADLGITVDELYTTYVAKTELNKLRWANGYGTTYVKIWDGQEDNVWLASYVKTLDVNAPDFKDRVAAGLQVQYEWVNRPKKAA